MKSVKKKLYKGIAAFYAVLFFMCWIFYTPVYAATTQNQNSSTSEEGNYSDYSFYNISSVIANTVNSCLAEGVKVGDVFGTANRATAGAFLGFPDVNLGNNVVGYFYTNKSKSEVIVSYKQLAQMDQTTNGNEVGKADAYAAFGATMHDIGADSTDLGSAMTFGRNIAGSTLYALFNISRVTNMIFVGMLTWLQKLNPFAFFINMGKVQAPGSAVTLQTDVVGSNNSIWTTPSIWPQALVDLFQNIYEAAQTIGLLSAVVFFALIIVFWFLNKTVFVAQSNKPFNHGSLFKKWFIRLTFLFVGIPILGTAYTAALDSLIKACNGQNGYANMNAAQVVQGVLCDYQDFCINAKDIDKSFNLKGDVKYQVDDNYKITALDAPMLLCATINRSTGLGMTNVGLLTNDSVEGLITNLQTPATNTAGVNEEFTTQLISMFMNGKQFTSAAYNNAWVSKYWQSGISSNTDRTDYVSSFIESYSSVQVVMSPETVIESNAGGDIKPYGDRFNVATDINPLHGGNDAGMSGDGGSYLAPGAQTIPSGFQLSPMSIYNYLNTEFDNSEMSIASSSQSLASASRMSHNSVNLIGNGIAAVVNFVLCCVMILAELVVALFYAFSLIFANIKRGFRFLLAVPGAFIGSISAISRVIVYGIMMILEVVMTILLYKLATELIYVIGAELAHICEDIAKFTVNPIALVTGLSAPVQIIVSMLTIVFYIWFIIVLIRMRKPVIKALDGVADSVVNTFMQNVQSSSPTANAVAKGMANLSNPSTAKTALGRRAEEKTNRSLAAMMGGGSAGGSAMADEFKTSQEAKADRAARRAKALGYATAGTQLVMGAGSVIAGAASGNPMAIANGVGQIKKGGSKAINTGKEAEAQRDAMNQATEAAVQNGQSGNSAAMDKTEQNLNNFAKDQANEQRHEAVNDVTKSAFETASANAGGGTGGAGASAATTGASASTGAGGANPINAATSETSNLDVNQAVNTATKTKTGAKSKGGSEVPLPDEVTNGGKTKSIQQKDTFNVEKGVQINPRFGNQIGGTAIGIGGGPKQAGQQFTSQILDTNSITMATRNQVRQMNDAVDLARNREMKNLANGQFHSHTINDQNVTQRNSSSVMTMGASTVSGIGGDSGFRGGDVNTALNRQAVTQQTEITVDHKTAYKDGANIVDKSGLSGSSASNTPSIEPEQGLNGGINNAVHKAPPKV